MQKNQASFRDSSGYVLDASDCVYRVIMPAYKQDFQSLIRSGFWALAQQNGFLPFELLQPCYWPEGADKDAIAVLKCDKLPFISYPSEWCFSQLKDAALLTLELQLLAVNHGFTLKDATAYNVQFVNGKPVFIDLLSFEKLRECRPWDAYGQFCSHFWRLWH